MYFLLLRKPQVYSMIYHTIEMETKGPIQLLSKEECIIINKWRIIQDFLTKMLSVGYLLGVIFYLIPPAFFRKLPFPVFIPENLCTEWYTRLYIIECIAIFLSCPAWVSLDLYLCIFLCQLCMHLELVYAAVQDLRGKDRATLHTIIRRHSKVLMYGQKLCEVVHYIFFAICCSYGSFLIFGTITIGEISWKTHGALAIKNIVTLVVCSSTIYLICYVGELLQDLSSRIGDGILLDNYAEHGSNRKYLKELEIMNDRCKLSLKIEYTPNMIVNMKLFTNIMNYVVSTYIFVNTMFVNPV
ncbi:odorant receptor 85b-like isoform X2 [Trichogramma pretiosum]|nr:odorant receptor 85b-like isoform X2 [Trichogramma pretiosum]